MFLDVALLALGIFLLWVSANWLVNGASSIALSFKIKPFIIGLTVIAFGTSAPELVVSILAATDGNSGMALGNVIGSNIANIALVLGISAVICPLEVEDDVIFNDIPFMIAISVLTFALAQDGSLSLLDGIVLLVFMGFFLYRNFKKSQSFPHDMELDDTIHDQNDTTFSNVIKISLGCIGLVAGAKFLVTSAIALGIKIGLDPIFVSLTVLALGTSLPELAASAMAAYKGKTELCLGNIVGSNIMNLLMVLGVVCLIGEIKVDVSFWKNEMLWMLVITALVFPLVRIGRKITRTKGTIMILIYFLFIILSYSSGHKEEKEKQPIEKIHKKINE